MAAKDKARGSALELHVGRLFGGRRRRNGEGLGFDDCIQHDSQPLWLSIECKAYAVLQLQRKWVEQAIRNCGGRPWVIAQRPKGSRHVYVTLYLDTLLDPEFVRRLSELVRPRDGEVSPPPPTTEGGNDVNDGDDSA